MENTLVKYIAYNDHEFMKVPYTDEYVMFKFYDNALELGAKSLIEAEFKKVVDKPTAHDWQQFIRDNVKKYNYTVTLVPEGIFNSFGIPTI